MMEQKKADPNLALRYLSEVASTYAESLADVVKAPFINQVNICLRTITEDREALLEEIAALKGEREASGEE